MTVRPRTLTRTGAATAATAIVGSLASASASTRWYRRLDTPPFQPPAAAFPVVWTVLYVDIAVASAVAIDAMPDADRATQRAAFQRALAVNLTLNASWTWVFFRFRRLPAATLVASLLALSSVDLARRAGRASAAAGWALAPYAIWCSFAAVLSGAIWRRNR